MYPSMIVDGDDLLILSRTAVGYENGRMASERKKHGLHDANLLTAHRMRDSRSLAMDIKPLA